MPEPGDRRRSGPRATAGTAGSRTSMNEREPDDDDREADADEPLRRVARCDSRAWVHEPPSRHVAAVSAMPGLDRGQPAATRRGPARRRRRRRRTRRSGCRAGGPPRAGRARRGACPAGSGARSAGRPIARPDDAEHDEQRRVAGREPGQRAARRRRRRRARAAGGGAIDAAAVALGRGASARRSDRGERGIGDERRDAR